jgi:sugar lactone lactonase YvrE
VLTLPTAAAETSSFPNGLAFHDGDLYVSDSLTGAVWRTHPRGSVDDVQRTPWLKSPVLAPKAKGGLGINGIAFRDDSLYGVVADSGVLVRVGLGRHGRPTPVRVVTRSAALVHADGVTFDAAGRLWATTNGGSAPRTGSLVRVEHSGRVTVVLAGAPWMDYPTQPVFGTTRHTARTLYVTNGAFNSSGNSTVVALGSTLMLR